MDEPILPRLSAYDNDPDTEFLEQHDACIRAEAQKVFTIGIFAEDVFDLENDELSQSIRIKLWKSRQKRFITNPRAYIRTIAHTTAIDMIRRHKPTVSLSNDENGESDLGDRLTAQNEGLQDPAYEIELGEIDPGFLTKLVDAILSLPPRQRQAVLYALKDHQDDALPLIKALKAQGVDIEALDEPKVERERRLLKVSLSLARKKLQWLREMPIAV